jgi:hypothetical protein
MRISAKELIGVVGIALLCFGRLAIGQSIISSPGTNAVTYTGNYSTIFNNQDGSFGAGTYSAVINGTGSSSGIICDDYKDEITSGEQWSANAYQAQSLASGNVSNTLFGSTVGLTGYAEVATLVNMMFSGGTAFGNISGIKQAEISAAIWDITTSGGIKGLDSNALALVTAVESEYGGNTSAATSYLATMTDLWILTPTASEPGRPQEMWVAVPEGGAAVMYFLLAGAFCFGAMFFRHRNEPVSRGTSDLFS